MSEFNVTRNRSYITINRGGKEMPDSLNLFNILPKHGYIVTARVVGAHPDLPIGFIDDVVEEEAIKQAIILFPLATKRVRDYLAQQGWERSGSKD